MSHTTRVLTRILERLRGMKGAEHEEAHLVLVPCRDIHTFGMKRAIDVAFVDMTGTVIAVYREVGPHRRIRHAAARLVVERPARSGTWFECGDDLFCLPPRAQSNEADTCLVLRR